MDHLSAGREALKRFAWAEALSAFAEAERQEPLSPDDLLQKASAAWWDGDLDDAVEAFELAHGQLVELGRRSDAAGTAVRLAELAFRRFSMAVGQGWLARAERLLEGEPESKFTAQFLALKAIGAFLLQNDFPSALELMERGLTIARRHQALDEAAAAAAAGRIDPRAACDVYCQTISTCSELGEYRRAAEWVEQADRWMLKRDLKGYRGVCRVHRAEIKRIGGLWAEAESEARIACDELSQWGLLDGIGAANYEIGVIRLGLGDLAGAEAAFGVAHEHGRTPQPGLALLLLARGDVGGAAHSIEAALAATADALKPSGDLLERAHLLPARVEIALAAGDLPAATRAANELSEIAGTFASDAIRAPALTALGAVQLAGGSNGEAVATLDAAWRLWHELEVPYESARARSLLGRARAATGDLVTARLEWRAARTVFERLGAARDLRDATSLLEEGGEVDQRRITKTFLFSDIVTSTDLVRLIGDTAWNELIAWHDRLLREAFREHAGTEVRHTGDGFFVTFDRPADAIRCAVTIQRRLKSHRREHGFAPLVRIGIHSAEASPHGTDYAGHGVHVAARVGAEARGEEIVVSSAVLDAAQPLEFAVSGRRTVNLKGVTEPIEVSTVAWESN